MTLHLKTRTDAETFEAFVEADNNHDKLFELVDGEIVEVPSNPYASKIAGCIFGELYIYLKHHDLGHLTSE